MAEHAPVKFLIISDTHCAQLGESDSPYAFRQPMPKCDVLLHCGDLTHVGTIEEYHQTLKMLSDIDAELKLVIAGNHDLSLDPEYLDVSMDRAEEQKLKADARNLWTGEAARSAGVTLLDEGLHSFVLKSGAKFTVYASPYTPDFCNWGFPYERDEDRFNPVGLEYDEEIKNIAVHPVTSFPSVDIMMTHGPPHDYLAVTFDKIDAGCRSLMHAVRRVKPRLHCFGHIHEGWGAKLLEWDADQQTPEKVLMSKKRPLQEGKQNSEYLDIRSSAETAVHHGSRTLLVNAAIMNVRYKPVNAPWVVEMELPLANGD